MPNYDPKITPWQVNEEDYPKEGSLVQRLKFLLRYAILAPSNQNTQPWKFSIHRDEIRLFADMSCWLKIADSDMRELYISIGSALENLLIAAEHFGFEHLVAYFPKPGDDELAVLVKLIHQDSPPKIENPELFNAITRRKSSHLVFKDRIISQKDINRLQECCTEEGIWLHITDDATIKHKVDELMARDGAKDSEVLMSSLFFAVFSTKSSERKYHVKIGQMFERLFLTATLLGISIHPMDQIILIPKLKAEVTKLIPEQGVIPQLAFRLGYAEPDKEHTPRRPLKEVLILNFI